MAGLAAAWELSRQGHDVVIFEKSRGLSGRAATRRREGACYDHGANFFRTNDPEIHDLIHHLLPTDDLVQIPGPVWTFDSTGAITPGSHRQNSHPKYTYRNGISNLGKLLVGASGPTLHREALITRLSRKNDNWFLHTDDSTHGPFTHLILTPPAPQSAALLDSVIDQASALITLHDTLAECRYHKQFTFVLGYDHRLPRAASFHALVNSDRNHDLSWLSFEEDKPGHVEPSKSLLILQMNPAWSAAHYETPREDLFPLALAAARSLLPDLPDPAWQDSQRWGFAHPAKTPTPEVLLAGESLGLFLAGDTLAGRGRIPLALKTGLQAASRLLEGALTPR